MTSFSATARYARHELIDGWDQSSLSAATVVVIGVGAVGSEVARLLARSGVRRLLLCDPDTVEPSNLSRGALYGPADLDRPKATAAAAALTAERPDLDVTVRVADFRRGVGLAELRAAGLVLSCLDSVADRIALASRCALADVTMLDAGTHSWGGEVRHYPAGGACYACGCTAAERSRTSWHVACADPPGHVGASGPIAAMTAAWQAVTATRILFGLAVPAGVVRLDPVTGESRTSRLRRDPDCPCHRRIDRRRITAAGFGAGATVAELLALVEPGEQVHTWQPPDAAGLTPTALTAADPDASLATLGVPPGEILPVLSPPAGVRYLELER